jgi:hypothetical protein
MTNNINKLPVQTRWPIKKIKIIRTPDIERCQPPLVPPFGISVITSYLREKALISNKTTSTQNASHFGVHITCSASEGI